MPDPRYTAAGHALLDSAGDELAAMLPRAREWMNGRRGKMVRVRTVPVCLSADEIAALLAAVEREDGPYGVSEMEERLREREAAPRAPERERLRVAIADNVRAYRAASNITDAQFTGILIDALAAASQEVPRG